DLAHSSAPAAPGGDEGPFPARRARAPSRTCSLDYPPREMSENLVREASRDGPTNDRRSRRRSAIAVVGRRPRDRSSWGGMERDGFVERNPDSPLDGRRGTRSPTSTHERPRPTTEWSATANRRSERRSVSDRQDLSPRRVVLAPGGAH